MKIIVFFITALFLSGCLSKSERNKSVINGLWELVPINENDDLRFQLLYFSNGHLIFFDKQCSNRFNSFDYSYSVHNNQLIFFKNTRNNKSRLVTFYIKKLEVNKLILGFSNDPTKNLTYKRVYSKRKNGIKRIAVASGGLQAWDVEVDSNGECSAAWNRETPREVIQWKFPKWKQEAICTIYSAYDISSMIKKKEEFVACGGSFSMIIKTNQDRRISIYPVNKSEFYTRTLFRIVWDEAMNRDLDALPRTIGKITLHEELKELIGRPKPIEFISPN